MTDDAETLTDDFALFKEMMWLEYVGYEQQGWRLLVRVLAYHGYDLPADRLYGLLVNSRYWEQRNTSNASSPPMWSRRSSIT
jgi:hypothetical protein